MREQLERMNWQMSMMMQGCRLQSPLFDMQITQVPLEKCIRASIRNNQFFLIQNQFQIDMQAGDIVVYTDEVWLTYILDQIINNAVKYARVGEEHHIRFWAEKMSERFEAFLRRPFWSGCLSRITERESGNVTSGAFLRRATQAATTTTASTSRPEWGCTWQTKSQGSWNTGYLSRAVMGNIRAFASRFAGNRSDGGGH